MLINRWLAPRSAGFGLLIGVAVFLSLHIAYDANLAVTLITLLAGAAVAAALLWRVRRTQLLRTRQAQGYFAAAMIIAAIVLVMLPPGLVLSAF
ncbi:hypothetical protein [Cumulibacter soli]|uniref:hypothetical protein n=1 Tax=Cumulibacter soli TaxID=2546344 RepID=UPI001067C0DB|nr:hypothetical protein [Cumulibacter soli]